MVSLTGEPLSLDEVLAVCRHDNTVEIAPVAWSAIDEGAATVARLAAGNDVVYGVTTGFGAFATRSVDPEHRSQLQHSLIVSHAAGVGKPLPREVVRAMMLLRLRTLCAGRSGVRREVIAALVHLLNNGVTPWVPEHGSLGASGDLAPLAHIAAVLLGEGWVVGFNGEREEGRGALVRISLEPVVLGPKEGLALINGTDGMTALLVLAITDACDLLVAADAAAALSLDSLMALADVFDDEVVALRAAPGPRTSARHLRALLGGSRLARRHDDDHTTVQDAYSLRCTPQVHGAAYDLVDFCRTTVERELASIVDNPVLLGEGPNLRSTGNFHGQALAYAADCLAMVCADMAAISERRTNRLLDEARSKGLSPFLTEEPGLNSGYMIAQYTASACVSRLRALATPLSVHSAVTSAEQEDHVSMGFEAALRTRDSIDLLTHVIAIEYVCGAQALDLRGPTQAGRGTQALHAALREHVPHLGPDRVVATDIAKVEKWLHEDGTSFLADLVASTP